MCSCSATKTTLQSKENRASKQTIAHQQRDSIALWIKDSVIVQKVKDSVFCERWHIQTKYIDRQKNDTVIKTDTLYQDIKASKITKEHFSWLEKWWRTIVVCIIVCGVFIIIRYAKKWLQLVK